MVEFSLSELVLLIWAVVITAMYLDSERDAHVSKKILFVMLNDPVEREKAVAAFEKFKATQ